MQMQNHQRYNSFRTSAAVDNNSKLKDTGI